jgi:glyoxylase-like metal-dependent hydrolase (beta-lactamase superfamily II)
MVPLYGHTTGHVGIAVNVDGGWLLHAGDAYVSALQLNRYLPGLLLGGAAFGDPDPLLAARRVRTAARLAALVQQHGDEVTVFCAHDAHAYGELARHNPTPSPESKEA